MYIGVHTDYKEAMKSALLQISADMRRFPNAQSFGVRWCDSKLAWLRLDDEVDRMDVYYDRTDKTLSRGCDGGGATGWSGVTEQIIARAAVSRDPDAALTKFGCPTG